MSAGSGRSVCAVVEGSEGGQEVVPSKSNSIMLDKSEIRKTLSTCRFWYQIDIITLRTCKRTDSYSRSGVYDAPCL